MVDVEGVGGVGGGGGGGGGVGGGAHLRRVADPARAHQAAVVHRPLQKSDFQISQKLKMLLSEEEKYCSSIQNNKCVGILK